MAVTPQSVERAAGLVLTRAIEQVPARVYRVAGHTVVLFLSTTDEQPWPAQCNCTAGHHGIVCAHQLAAAHEFKEGR